MYFFWDGITSVTATCYHKATLSMFKGDLPGLPLPFQILTSYIWYKKFEIYITPESDDVFTKQIGRYPV